MINGGLNLTNDNLTAVNLGFTDANNTITFGSPSLTVSNNVTGTWTATTGSLSSGGQCGVNNGGFVCASISPLNGLILQTGQTYSFTWNYTLGNPNGIFAAGDVHIGAEYGPNQGNYQGLIVSQTIPEPGTLTMLGFGLVALGGLVRRRLLGN
jgi:PEP-CTERM motif-containing protein